MKKLAIHNGKKIINKIIPPHNSIKKEEVKIVNIKNVGLSI